MFPQTLTSRSAKTSPPSSAFVAIPPPTAHRGAVFGRQPHIVLAPSSSLPPCTDDDETTTTTAAEVRTIVAAAAAGAGSFWEPRCCVHHHYRDSPLVVLVPEGSEAGSDDDDDDDDDSVRTKALLGSVVAGFGFALWALLVLQPLSAVHFQVVVMESTSTYLCVSIAMAMTVSALLTVLLTLCEAFIGPCSVTGCGFGTRHTNKNRHAPFPSLSKQLRRCLQIALGNTAGAVFGATLAAVAIHSAADVGFSAAADMMCAAIDAARTVSDDHPPRVFLSAVVAGFLLTAATSCSDLVAKRGAWVRTLLLFCACFVVVLFDLRLGLVDKSLVSAAAAFNALRPLMNPLGPNVFNYLFALVGNILGAALARAAADIVNCLHSPSRSGPKQFVV